MNLNKWLVAISLYLGLPQKIIALFGFILALIVVAPMFLYGIFFQNAIKLDAEYQDQTETILGEDKNSNNIRDDIEAYGNLKIYHKDKKLLKAYMNWGEALYANLNLDPSDKNYISIKRWYIDSLSCLEMMYSNKHFNSRIVGGENSGIWMYHFESDSRFDHYFTGKAVDLAFNTSLRKKKLSENEYLSTFSAKHFGEAVRIFCKRLDLSEDDLFSLEVDNSSFINPARKTYQIVDKERFKNNYREIYKDYIDFNIYKGELTSLGEFYEKLYPILDSHGYTVKSK